MRRRQRGIDGDPPPVSVSCNWSESLAWKRSFLERLLVHLHLVPTLYIDVHHAGRSSDVQCAHLVALMGTEDRQYGQSRVAGGGTGTGFGARRFT